VWGSLTKVGEFVFPQRFVASDLGAPLFELFVHGGVGGLAQKSINRFASRLCVFDASDDTDRLSVHAQVGIGELFDRTARLAAFADDPTTLSDERFFRT